MSKRKDFTLPTLHHLAALVLSAWQAAYTMTEAEADDDEDASLDLRLHAFGPDRFIDWDWSFNNGDPSYDTAHGDVIGWTSVDVRERPTVKAATQAARELLADAKDQIEDWALAGI